MAGQEGFEPPTAGFGDRCSTSSSYWPVCLFGFFVYRVFAIKLTILLKSHFFWLGLLVSGFAIVAALALRTLQMNYISHLSSLFNGAQEQN